MYKFIIIIITISYLSAVYSVRPTTASFERAGRRDTKIYRNIVVVEYKI